MATYETLVLVEPAVGDEEIAKYIRKLEGIIGQYKGKLIKEEKLGRKKLAFPIKKKTEGSYVRLEVELEPKVLSEYERTLRVESKILREMTLRCE